MAASRKGLQNPYCLFVRDQLPELRRRGVPVASVVEAIPYCSQAWALLTEEEKMAYAEKARKLKEKKHNREGANKMCNLAHPVPACLTANIPSDTSFLHASALSWENDQAVVADIFYFLNIYSHGNLPPACEQRFLPCEIGCVKYSLQDGIMADFHHFIDPGDTTHKILLSGFHLPRTSYAVVLQELLEFVQPSRGVRPRFCCRSNDRFRISWCLKRMASLTGIKSHFELLAVEDLLTKLYQNKNQEELSKVCVWRELDAFLWDFSSNTRCKWHEENDIVYCALASCKKMAYCISKSLASVYGVPLTAAHLPIQDSVYDGSMLTRMTLLDTGHLQKMKAEGFGCDKHFTS